MKKRVLISKLIGLLGLLIFVIGISYLITYTFEKHKYQDINLLVTFEDNKTFTIENTEKLTKETVLKTYPYKFKIENKGKKTTYQIIIEDQEKENIKRTNLNYLLYKNDQEFKNGKLSDLKNNILTLDTINAKKTNNYSLYIYTDEEIGDFTYQYSLKINVNK